MSPFGNFLVNDFVSCLTASQKSAAHVGNKAVFGVIGGLAGLALSKITIGKYVDKKKEEILSDQNMSNEEKKKKLEQLRALSVACSGLVTGTVSGVASVASSSIDNAIERSDLSALDLDFDFFDL